MEKGVKEFFWGGFLGLLIGVVFTFVYFGMKENLSRTQKEIVESERYQKILYGVNEKTILVTFTNGKRGSVTGMFKNDEIRDEHLYFSTIEPKDIDTTKYKLKDVTYNYKKIK